MTRRRAAIYVFLAFLALGVVGTIAWLVQGRGAPEHLSAADPVGALVLDDRAAFGLWTAAPGDLSSSFEVLFQQAGAPLGVHRLAEALQVESSALVSLDRALRFGGVDGLALRVGEEGEVELRARLAPVRARVARLWGRLLGGTWLAGGPIQLDGRQASIRWITPRIWSVVLPTDRVPDHVSPRSTGTRAVLGGSSASSESRTAAAHAAERDAPPTLLIRFRDRDAVEFAGLLGGRGGEPESLTAGELGDDPASSLYRVEVDPVGEVAVRLEPWPSASTAVRHFSPLVDSLLRASFAPHGVLLAAVAGNVDRRAVLVLEQEYRPNITQVPSAATLAWGDATLGRLPGERLSSFLDVRTHQFKGRESRARAYDQASVLAAEQLELALSPRSWPLAAGESSLWCSPRALAGWLDSYLKATEEFRLVPSSRRRIWRAGQRLLESFPEDVTLWLQQHQRHWQLRLSKPANPVDSAAASAAESD